MEPLIIQPRETTPYIAFDSNSGIMEVRGVSYEEDSYTFYKPIIEWLDQYRAQPQESTVLNIEFKYFNTSTAKCFYDLLERFSFLKKSGKQVIINWYYDKNDEQLRDEIENFSELAEMPFNIKPI